MPLVAVPNVSEGRRPAVVSQLTLAVERAGGRVLDVHVDAVHNRSVLTVTADPDALVEPLRALARAAASTIDLRRQEGVHPRLGALDVCPIVPIARAMTDAATTAHAVGRGIAADGIPVYFYDHAARDAIDLPALRRGGLDALLERRPPDLGSRAIDARVGVVCVGARGPLIAFNVVVSADMPTAAAIARKVRTSSGGPPGIRALAFDLGGGRAQISMNLVDPDTTGLDDAFCHVKRAADAAAVPVAHTEIVGLVCERHLPEPDAEAARLLIEPGRSLEAAIEKS